MFVQVYANPFIGKRIMNMYAYVTLVGKLFTNLLNSRLQLFCDSHDIINQFQTCFRKQQSKIDKIFVLNCLKDIFKSQHKKLYSAFIDLKAAFDKIDRQFLWSKL